MTPEQLAAITLHARSGAAVMPLIAQVSAVSLLRECLNSLEYTLSTQAQHGTAQPTAKAAATSVAELKAKGVRRK